VCYLILSERVWRYKCWFWFLFHWRGNCWSPLNPT